MQTNNRTGLNDILSKALDYSKFDTSTGFLQETELKVLAERYRCDQNILTSNTIQEMVFAETKNLKQLYNYDLMNAQERFYMEKEVQSEFVHSKMRPDKLMVELLRDMENRSKY